MKGKIIRTAQALKVSVIKRLPDEHLGKQQEELMDGCMRLLSPPKSNFKASVLSVYFFPGRKLSKHSGKK